MIYKQKPLFQQKTVHHLFNTAKISYTSKHWKSHLTSTSDVASLPGNYSNDTKKKQLSIHVF